jgi:hypothetical protein
MEKAFPLTPHTQLSPLHSHGRPCKKCGLTTSLFKMTPPITLPLGMVLVLDGPWESS